MKGERADRVNQNWGHSRVKTGKSILILRWIRKAYGTVLIAESNIKTNKNYD